MLADVGIRADVQITEWSTVKEPTWDLFGWYNNVVDAGDPVLNVSKFVGLEADAESSAANNYGHYDNSGAGRHRRPSRNRVRPGGAEADSLRGPGGCHRRDRVPPGGPCLHGVRRQ